MAGTFGTPFAPGNSSANSTIPIGMSTYMTDRGPFFVADDKTEWLRQATIIPYKSKYSKVAKIPYLRTFGGTPANAGTGTASSIGFVSGGRAIATNGTGTIVIATGTAGTGGSATHFYRSTDGGVTWGNVSATVSSSHYINAIVWAGNRFVAAAATSTVSAVSFYYSSNGSSWTAGTTLTGLSSNVGVSLAYDTVNGTVMAFCGYTSANAVFRCTTNATFAAPTTGANANPGGNLQYVAGNNGKFICSGGGSGQYYYSTDQGVNFTSYDPLFLDSPSSNGFFAYVNGVFLMQSAASNTTYYYTTTPETVSSWKIGQYPANITLNYNSTGWNNSDKTKFYLGIKDGFIYTSDGINWNRSNVYDSLRYLETGPIYYQPLDSGNGVNIFSSYSAINTTEVIRNSSLSIPPYIGNDIAPTNTNHEYIRVY